MDSHVGNHRMHSARDVEIGNGGKLMGAFSLSRVFAQIRSFCLAVMRRARVDSDMESELAHHLECMTAELVRQGVPHTEAARRARIAVQPRFRLHGCNVPRSGLHHQLSGHARRVPRRLPGWSVGGRARGMALIQWEPTTAACRAGLALPPAEWVSPSALTGSMAHWS